MTAPGIPVGPNAERLIFADFNGDGLADLAVSNFGSLDTNLGGNVGIFLAKTDGVFASTAMPAQLGPTPVAIYAADFNGDGKLDLAAANVTANTVSVALGNGDGTFQGPQSYPVATSPQSVIAADFNGDGRIDLAVANLGGGVSVLLGNGNGSFQSAVNYSTGAGSATYIAAMDFNGDGKLDLAVANPDANSVVFLYGNGDGTFQAPVQYAAGAGVDYFGVIPAENGAALITNDYVASAIIEVPVLSSGIAGTPQLYAVKPQPTGIAAADLNGDKYPDMVAADGVISVLLRNPAGAFNAAVNYMVALILPPPWVASVEDRKFQKIDAGGVSAANPPRAVRCCR